MKSDDKVSDDIPNDQADHGVGPPPKGTQFWPADPAIPPAPRTIINPEGVLCRATRRG